MKIYKVTRLRDGDVVATVDLHGQRTYPLPHLVHHSPTGFEFGYGGSGPADLARSIVGDLFETEDPAPKDYQNVKAVFLAPLEGDGPFEITETEIRNLLTPLEDCC